MSLHLANLSSRVRKTELERVFRGFGRCTVQLKDGYGFAVYEFHEDAEKALRTLKGRKICGQSVYLSWSNKQPKPVQRFPRSARPHDKRFGRSCDQGGEIRGRNFSSGHGGYSASGLHLLDRGREIYHSADDDRAEFNINDSPMDTDPVEHVSKESGHVEFEHNEMGNGRWGEQDDHLHYDSEFDGQMGVDNYNFNFVNERRKGRKNRVLNYLAGSQSAGTSPEKKRRLHSYNNRVNQTCFKCGSPGHRIHECRENSAYQSNHGCYAKATSEVIREDSRSGGWLQSSCRNSRPTRQSDADRKPSHSGKVEITGRRYLLENESRRDKRDNSNYRKRRERDDQIVEARDDKKSRSVGANCHSRSASPIPHSLSASRSNSRAYTPSSKSLKSKSTSSSKSPSSSLSLSPGRSLPSSPNKIQINLNGFSEGALSPLPKEPPNKVRQHSEPEVREENLSIANRDERSLTRNADNVSNYQLMEAPINSKQHKHDSQSSNSTKDREMNLNDIVEDDQIIQNQEAMPNESRQGLESDPVQKSAPSQTDVHVLSEKVSSSGNVVGDTKLGQLHRDGVSNSTTPQLHCEVETPSSSLLEIDDKETSDVNMAARNLRTEDDNNNALEIKNQLEPTSSKRFAGSHLSFSAEELSRVLKHYGLKHPKDSKHLDVGDYFGSSRLWPWEIIYYRRLKKGPISMENYARRVVQNKAFNITDKYIRSSSGWGELIEENDKKEELNLF